MNEEIEYAEMLEIPVSTINVVRKKSRRKKQSARALHQDSAPLPTPLKDSLIAQINSRMQPESDDCLSAEENLPTDSEGSVNFDPIPDRIDTVRLFADETERENAFREAYAFADEESDETEQNLENDGGMYEFKHQTHSQKAAKIVLNTEFALACALCGAIFITNIFVPNSAINTFFRAASNASAVAAVDTRPYSDFTLSPVVSELSEAELHLSATGILSFQEACHVYPAANGEVGEIIQNTDGSYSVKICYSDTFTGVFGGLEQVYYSVGDTVKCNVPFAYADGETEVQVTMYSGGVLLNCFELTEENCLAWLEE
jgi:hypothetical protein